MPISATGCNRRERGFTLVELMVVLVIIGLMSSVVLFALPDPRGTLRQEAVRLAARAHAARDMAIVSSRPVRLRIDASGYAFDQRRLGVWAPMRDKPFAGQSWDVGLSLSAPAAIAFDPTGGANPPGRVVLTRDTATIAVRFAADGAIDVEG